MLYIRPSLCTEVQTLCVGCTVYWDIDMVCFGVLTVLQTCVLGCTLCWDAEVVFVLCTLYWGADVMCFGCTQSTGMQTRCMLGTCCVLGCSCGVCFMHTVLGGRHDMLLVFTALGS